MLRDKWHRAANTGTHLPLAELEPPQVVLDWITDFCNGDTTKGLLLTGNTGAGKTTLVKAICHEVIERAPTTLLGRTEEVRPHWPVYFTAYPNHIADVQRRMLLENKKQYDDEFEDIDLRVASLAMESKRPEWVMRLAVLDDIGSEYSSGSTWVATELNRLLRARGGAGLTTLATTNTELADWEEMYGPATSSYAHEVFTEVTIATRDRRL